MVHIAHGVGQWETVDVQRRRFEIPLGAPETAVRFAAHDVERFARMIEIRQVVVDVGLRRRLVLNLSDQKIVLRRREELALGFVEVDERAVHLGRHAADVQARSTPNANLDRRVAHRDERQGLRPVLREEEREHVVIGVVVRTLGVIENVVGRHRTRRIAVAVENVVHALDVERIHFDDLLTSDPERDLGRVLVAGVQALGVVSR